MSSGQDRVDELLEAWQQAWPEGDFSGRQLIWRIQMLSKMIDRILDRDVYMAEKIARSGGRVLSTLRSGSPPCQKSAGQLARTIGITPGSMTSTIDQLEKLGLVERSPDPNDRRGVLITLTDEGAKTADAVRSSYAKAEAEILSSLDSDDREQLATMLRRFLRSLEEARPDSIPPI